MRCFGLHEESAAVRHAQEKKSGGKKKKRGETDKHTLRSRLTVSLHLN